jgi:hypothetical protein
MLAVLPLIVPIGVFTTLWAIAEIHARLAVLWFDDGRLAGLGADSPAARILPDTLSSLVATRDLSELLRTPTTRPSGSAHD